MNKKVKKMLDKHGFLCYTGYRNNRKSLKSEIEEMSGKLVSQTFERDRDGDGIADSSLSDDEANDMIRESWEKYGGLNDDDQIDQFFTSAKGVAEHFAWNHGRMQSFVNDMVDIAGADGYIDSTEETIINRLADCWGCTANISYQGGVPIILFVW